MKKKFILLILLFSIFFNSDKVNALTNEDLSMYRTEENKIEGEPYLNPKWIEWNNLSDEEKSEWEVIPEMLITDFIYEKKSNEVKLEPFSNYYDNSLLIPNAKSIPTKYSLKDEGYMSPVKNQNPLGLCWAFASVGAVESNALRTLGKSLIFSERQIDYAVSDPSTSITEGYNPYGDPNQVLGNGGGWFSLAAKVFNSGISPVLTSKYGNYTTNFTKKNLSTVINSNNVDWQVTDTVNFPYLDIEHSSDTTKEAYRDMIKEHILNYGGVYVSTIVPDSRSGSCYNSRYNMIYQTSSCTFSEENPYHAMLIIGWDDTYGLDENGDGIGDGAWLLKNSWGSGSYAFPYLSYNSIEVYFNGVVSIQEKKWDRNYDYTDLGKTSSSTRTFYKDGTTSEYLKRITFINDYSYLDQDYKIYVSTTGNASDKTLIGTVTTNNPGIYSIDVNSLLLDNDKFTIYAESQKGSNYNATSINAFTLKAEEISNVKVSTKIENDYVSIDSTTTEKTFDLYSITENIEIGESLSYRIYNSSNEEITSLFTFTEALVVNDNMISKVTFNTSNVPNGNYKIETYYNNVLQNTYDFEIGYIKVNKVSITSTVPEFIVGDTYKLNVSVSPSNAHNKKLKYESNNELVATVDDTGLITAIGEGTTNIIVSATDGSNISDSIEITVYEYQRVETLEVESNEYIILKNGTTQINTTVAPDNAYNKTLKYESSNEEIVKVSQTGLITGISAGTAEIVITTTDRSNISKRVNVVVKSMEGEGSKESPFIITSVDDFDKIRYGTNNYYILKNDIDFSNIENFTQIASFNGVLNGNNKTISNLNMTTAEDKDLAIFNTISEAEIFDLNITDVNLSYTGTSYGTKGIATLANTSNYSTFKNIKVNNSNITYENRYNKYAAGLIVESTRDNIFDCQVNNSTISGKLVGGLIYKTNKDYISASSSVRTKVTGVYEIGGLIGLLSESVLIDSYTQNTVDTSKISCLDCFETRVGGLIGTVWGASFIFNNYAVNNSTGVIDTKYYGTLIGYLGSSEVHNNYPNGSGAIGETLYADVSSKITKKMIEGSLDENGNLEFCSFNNCGENIWIKEADKTYITSKSNHPQEIFNVRLIPGKANSINSNFAYPYNQMFIHRSYYFDDEILFYYRTSDIISIDSSTGNFYTSNPSVIDNKSIGEFVLDVGHDLDLKIHFDLRYENTINNFKMKMWDTDLKDYIEIEDDDTIKVNKGSTKTITFYDILPEIVDYKSFQFIIDNKEIVETKSWYDDEYVTFTALELGKTVLTIKTQDGGMVTKRVNVEVVEQGIDISDIQLQNGTIYEEVGGKLNFRVILNYLDFDMVNIDILDSNGNNIYGTDKQTVNINEKGYADVELDIPSTISEGTYTIKVTAGDYSAEETFKITEYIHLSSIEINKDLLELIKGKDETLEIIINPTNAINKTITWTSSDEKVATVDEEGKVTAIGKGTATITVTSEDGGKTDTCEIIVKEPKITIGEKTTNSNYNGILYEGYGGTVIVPITTQDIEENSKLTLKYYKDNIEMTNAMVSNVFKIGGNVVNDNKVNLQIGVISNAERAKYKIEVSSDNAEMKSFEFDVIAPILVEGIEANDVILEVDTTKKANYTITPEEALNKNVEFSIRNKDESLTTLVAIVDEEGNVTGKNVGEAILTISSVDGGATKEVNVKVIERKISLSEVELGPNPLYDFIGGKVNLTAVLENINSENVKVELYQESDDILMTDYFDIIDNEAHIEFNLANGIDAGTYTIKVTAGDYNAEQTFVVTEYTHVSSIVLNKDSFELLKGKDETLKVTINPTDAINKKVTWSSSDESVATVDDNGKVTAIGRGTAIITVTSEDGEKTDNCEVTVKDPKVTLGEIKISSNYNNLLYKGYGGTITVPITRQDINIDEIIGLKYYKKDNEEFKQITNVDIFNQIHNSNTIHENNNSILKFDITSELEVGEYKVEMSYLNSNIIMFTFEVLEPVLVNDIEISDIKIPLDNNYYEIEYTVPEDATNKEIIFSIESNQTIIELVGNKIKGLEKGETYLIINSKDGSVENKKVKVEVIEKSINLTETEIIPTHIYNNNYSEKLYDFDGGTIKTKLSLSNINEIGLQYILIKSDDNEQNNIINKINVTKDILSGKLVLNINPKSLEAGNYKFKVIGENDYESNEIRFTINEYKTVENVDVKYNNQSVDTLNIFVGRENVELNGIINETATNKQVEWVLNNDNCSISDNNSHSIFLNAEKVGKCQITFKSKEKHNNEVNLEKNIIINVIDGNSTVSESLHQSNISNEFVDVKYGGIITNAIQFNNLKEDSNLTVEVYDGDNLLDWDYVEKNVMLLNNMLRTISLNVIPDVFNKPNEYTPSKELTVKYTYTLNDIDNTELTKEYKVNLSEYNPITKINLSKNDIKLDVNETYNIRSIFHFEPSNATNYVVTLLSNNTNVAITDGYSIKALSEGTATITVTSQENENVKATINVTVEKNDYLEFSNKVNIHNESGSKYLKGFNANNTYKDLMNNIDTNMNVVLKEFNGTKVTSNSSILKTGMKLTIGSNTYDIVIKGDMSGDGKMSITDLSQMRYHLAQAKGKVKSGAYKQAGDMNDKDGVTITDLSQMRKKLAGVN